MDRFKIMNAFQIKLLLAFLMLLDHLRYIHGLVAPETAAVLTLISRCVAPMFAYLAVEGIRHTRNLKKYCLLQCDFHTCIGNHRHSAYPVGKAAEDGSGKMGVCAFCCGILLRFSLW